MTTITSDWAPTQETRTDIVTARAATAMHDLLDRPGPAPADGDPLPMLWHWLAFLPQVRQSDLGADGHPHTGGFLPPTGDRLRMYAGGTVSFAGQVRVGEPLRRTSDVTDVVDKTGRTGPLLFVTVCHTIRGPHGSITETADIVYRAASPTSRTNRPTTAITSDTDAELWTASREIAITATLLFRFSALTYNAHRIHYDRDYATGVVGYPGLVVHGPLQAILLADHIGAAVPHGVLSGFTFRSVAPAFDTADLTLRRRDSVHRGHIDAAAFSDGRQTIVASATLDDVPETP